MTPLDRASVMYNGNRYFYLKTDGTMASILGAANPLRYRGYVVLIWVWAEGAR